MTDDTIGALISVLMIGLILSIGYAVMDPVAQAGDSEAERKDHAVGLDGLRWVSVNDDRGRNETVLNSRGNALRFTGADDSYLSSSASVDLSGDENWTVSQPVWVNESVDQPNATMTVLAIGDPDLLVVFDEGNWSAVWHGSSNSYRANISAPDPTNETHVYVSRDGSELTIWRNSTQGETVDITTESTVAENLTMAENCACTLDETRAFGANLSQAKRQELRDSPVLPLADEPTTLRILYDAGGGTDVGVYFASGGGTASNATWVSGFAGTEMDRDGLVTGGDYQWDDDGPKIRPTDGGRLDGHPVVYVKYDWEGMLSDGTSDVAEAMDLGGTVMLVIVAGLFLIVVGKFKE